MHIDEIRSLDRRAVEASIAVVAQARPADLDRPTPCAGWTLRDLLEHMTAQHRGFRAASLGHGADLVAWQTVPGGTDVLGEYESAARDVIEAFAADGVPDTAFALPEISTAIEFPAAQAIGFHFIDYVVHGWDVARALSREYVLDDELAPVALRIAEKVPNGAERTLPSAAFGPGLAVSPSAPVLDRILAALGRSPAWPDAPSLAAD